MAALQAINTAADQSPPPVGGSGLPPRLQGHPVARMVFHHPRLAFRHLVTEAGPSRIIGVHLFRTARRFLPEVAPQEHRMAHPIPLDHME